jgi:TetR/AcrR family transcriptional regulator, transcriptional repressor of bet genes
VRRHDLVEAAYRTFLEHGLGGMTMARIGERAGMSHGIVNYYFKSKDELLSAVVRKAVFMIMRDVTRRLRAAATARERVSAIIVGNFPPELFTRDIARAWVSFYAALGQKPEFERLQNAVDRRLASNLIHALRQITDEPTARAIAQGIAVLIDGLWLRHAKSNDRMSAKAAIRQIEDYVDSRLGSAG